MKRYEKYKPSGVEWIGEMPEHWDSKRLKYVASVQPSNVDKKTIEGELPVLLCNYMDVYKNEFIDSSINFMEATATEAEIAKFKIKKGDMLVTKDSETPDDIANPAFVKDDFENVICAYHLTQIRPNRSELIGEYLFRLFQENKYKGQFEVAANGVTRFGLSVSAFSDVFVPLPRPDEQTAIANYLDEKTSQIDTLIANKQKLIELLKEERTAIINHAVTKGINPNVKFKPSGIDWLGDIPVHWEVKKLKYVAEINSTSLTEKEDDDLEIEYIDISSVNENGDIIQTAFYFYSDAPSRARRIISKGDTIISTVRTYLKAIAFIDFEKDNLICSTGFAVIRPAEEIEPKLLFYLSRSEKMVDRIMAMSKGVSYPAIDSDDIKNLEGWFPNKEEQHTIAKHIENHTARIDATISKIEKEIELLHEYRTALISEVVTGKIKVI